MLRTGRNELDRRIILGGFVLPETRFPFRPLLPAAPRIFLRTAGMYVTATKIVLPTTWWDVDFENMIRGDEQERAMDLGDGLVLYEQE